MKLGVNLQTIEAVLGHTSGSRFVFAADGKTARSGSSDHSLKQWDVATGKVIRTFLGHDSRVLSVTLAPDGKTAISAGGDHTLNLWNIDAGQLTKGGPRLHRRSAWLN